MTVSNSKNNTKTTCSIVKTVTRSKINVGNISLMNVNDNLTNDSQIIPNTFNKYFLTVAENPSTQVLQPMQGLGQFKKSPPTISVHGLDPPISDSQPLCIPRHSIHPSIWGLVFPIAFCPPACPRWFSYMVDYLTFVLYVLSIWAWLS